MCLACARHDGDHGFARASGFSDDAEASPAAKVGPTNVQALAMQTEDANLRLRPYLKQQDHLSDEQVDQLVREITDRVWASIDCTTCANCCKELQIGLSGLRGTAGGTGVHPA